MARRRYRGLVRMSLGALGLPSLNRSVSAMDVVVGALAGVGGAYAARFLWNKFAPASIKAKAAEASGNPWTYVDDNVSALGSVAAGAALYFAQKKSNKGVGHLVGSLAGAVAFAKVNSDRVVPAQFQGIVAVNLGGRMRGIIANDGNRQALRGLVMPSGANQIEAGARWRVPAVQRAALGAIQRRNR